MINKDVIDYSSEEYLYGDMKPIGPPVFQTESKTLIQYRGYSLEIYFKTPFLKRLWCVISNPFLYLFTGKIRY